MTEEFTIDAKHPRAESLRIRKIITSNVENNVVALAGLIAHGRGEAFDYILGEVTTKPAKKAITAASSSILLAKHPILSVNGNVAALCSKELVKLSNITGAKLEVNLFHRLKRREKAIERILRAAGANEVLGVNEETLVHIEEIYSDRRKVDPHGIFKADVVFVPLEDGDRTKGLKKMGKKVITVDLNPLSRTAQYANITIVDNIIRTMPLLISETEKLLKRDKNELKKILKDYSNKNVLSESIKIMKERLENLAAKGVFIEHQ